MLAAVFGAERFHTYIYGWSFTIDSDHKPLESISRKNLADLHGYNAWCYAYRDTTSQSITAQVKKWSYQTHSLNSVPGQAQTLPLDIAIHHACIITRLQRSLPTSLCEWPRNVSSSRPHHHRLARGHQGGPSSPLSILATLRNPHHRGWPSPVRWSPHHSSCQKGENPASTASIPSRNNKVTVAHTCGSFFWPGINKAIKEVVCQCETCTQFQSQNAAAPLTPTPTPSRPWQMCATDIFMLEGIDHLVVGDFYLKDDLCLTCLPPGQSNANKVVSLLKEMFSEHGILKSFTLTMAHNMWVPSLPTSVHLGASHTKPQVHTTHSPMDLPRHVSSLPNMHSNEPSIVVLIHTLLC